MKITKESLIESGCQLHGKKWHYPKDGYYVTSPEVELFDDGCVLLLQSKVGGNRLQFVVRTMEDLRTIVDALAT